MKSNMQAKIERQTAFWQRENHDRPLIGFTGGYFSTDTLRMLNRSEGHLRPADINVERILEDCDQQCAAWTDCMGDLFWTASPLFAFRWFPAILGAPVFVGGDSVWAEPILKDYGLLDRIEYNPGDEWVQALFGLIEALVRHAAGRYPIATDQLLAPLTTLAEIRGSTELAFDIHDRPAELEHGLMRLTELWGRLIGEQFKQLPQWYGGYSSAQRHIWAPGRIIEFDEDPAFMFSPRHHLRFVVPSHRKLVGYADYPYIHLHSTQLHTIDHLLDLEELPGIELTPDYGQVIADMVPAIAKIRARKPIIVHGYLSAEEMRTIIDQVPPEGLCVLSRTAGPAEARQLQDAIL